MSDIESGSGPSYFTVTLQELGAPKDRRGQPLFPKGHAYCKYIPKYVKEM